MRDKLLNRRPGQNFDFVCGSTAFTALLGYYANGDLGDIFLRAGKVGTDVNIVMQEASVLASFALQHGATVKQMREAMPRKTDGTAEGPLGTLFDLLAKEDAKDANEELLR